ncbi:MAG: squalene/phytoene synthase family protein [Anaerolineae bacterium]|nr:squalene/phytoene synthase family protein [Anaerolineae bacterium]MDK1080677.1 squalene/phytoene synthase family protein [Anaerolineae bacterium]MDK1119250.1 squalene/phytoene synthase family protein [Anaerolineae bacterium]
MTKTPDNQLSEMVRAVSRTFAISIERLPSTLGEAVGLAYLLFRVSDCLEDNEALSAKHKAELLRLWAQVLVGSMPVKSLTSAISHLDESDPQVYVAQHAEQILEELHRLPGEIQKIIFGHANKTSLGMARWQEQGPVVNTEEEMDDYMHQVAGRVGYLLTDLFGWHSPALLERKSDLMPLSRHFGLALQTVNIIRGLRKDYERGWVYVPRTFYEPLGLTRDSLFVQENHSQALQVITRLADKAEMHLLHGLKYITSIPRNHYGIRLACMWPLFFALQTLTISRDNVHVIIDETKITRSDVIDIMRKTTLMGWSNHWLRRYYNDIQTVEPIP